MLTTHKEQQERSVQNKQKAQPWKVWPEIQDTINRIRGSLDTAEVQTSRWEDLTEAASEKEVSKTEIENENADGEKREGLTRRGDSGVQVILLYTA